MNIIEKISDLNINGYFDNSNGHVVVWFHNVLSNKPDIVAYLKQNMSWDVREIVSEQSEVFAEYEIITVKHKCLSIEDNGSQFDILVRKMLDSLIKNTETELPASVKKMKQILDNNNYSIAILN